MRYRDLNVRVNSIYDASISSKKLRELWSSNSRENGAHLCTFSTTWQNTGIFSQISQDILDRFLQSFHHMKVLWVQMIDLYLDVSRDVAMAIN